MSTELYKKIAFLKHEVGKLTKDKTNPFYNSKYFDVNSLLEHIEPLLEKHKLLLLQPIIGNELVTQIIDIESSELIISSLELPKIDDPQKLGSSITYYRRYTLQSMFALQSEDDDGNLSITTKSNDNDKSWINVGDKAWDKAIEKKLTLVDLRKYYKVSKNNAEQYLKELTKTL